MLSADEGLFVVCDGMGGARAGEVASQMAVEAISKQLNGEAPGPSRDAEPKRQAYLPHTSRLADAVRKSNECIYNQAQRDPSQSGMGTTVVGAWIRQNIVGVAHVGDSRAYLWHDGQLEPLTRDHSLAQAQLAAGLVDHQSAVPAEHHNVLVRVLGRNPNVDVELKEVPVRPGDYVVLCSDGLTRMVPEHVLAQTISELQEPQQICDRLIAAANSNGGADNITVVVVEVAASSWWQSPLNRWKRSVRRGQNAEAYASV